MVKIKFCFFPVFYSFDVSTDNAEVYKSYMYLRTKSNNI